MVQQKVSFLMEGSQFLTEDKTPFEQFWKEDKNPSKHQSDL